MRLKPRGMRRKIRKLFAPWAATRTMDGGYRMRLRPRSDELEMRMYLDGTYEPATLAFFDEAIRPGDTVVDVGANLGLMTLRAARATGPAGRVIAIEAHPATFRRLVGNLRRNGIVNVTALNEAAGAVREDARPIFDVPGVNVGRASLIEPDEAHRIAGMVPVRPLDDMLAGIGPVRLVKIDVEGFEAEVLRGATETLKGRPIVCMELVTSQPTERGEDPLEAHRLIMATGLYRCHRFAMSKFRPSPLVPVESEGELAGFHDNLIYLPA